MESNLCKVDGCNEDIYDILNEDQQAKKKEYLEHNKGTLEPWMFHKYCEQHTCAMNRFPRHIFSEYCPGMVETSIKNYCPEHSCSNPECKRYGNTQNVGGQPLCDDYRCQDREPYESDGTMSDSDFGKRKRKVSPRKKRASPKRKNKKKKEVIPKRLKNLCKKLKLRLTITRNGKRYPKSRKVLEKQCKNKLKKKK